MTPLAMKHPVQLLCDARGIYGIGNVDHAAESDRYRAQDIILRPDRLLQGQPASPAAMQMIIGGFRHGMFSHMAEEHLRKHIHWEMLRRRGLKWPPEGNRWWSEDSKQQACNRHIYHGLRLASLSVVNGLLREALQEAAEPNALALARRFPFHERYKIYCSTAANPRAVQFTNVFPTLGLAVFGRDFKVFPGSDLPIFELDPSHRRVNLVSQARRLVEGGAPLRKIAELMGVPMAFRGVKPGAAHLALAVVNAFDDPRLVDAHMPGSLSKMKLWLNCVRLAQSVGPDFVQWTSRHAIEIGGSPAEILAILRDIADWVFACYRASVPPHVQRAIRGEERLVPAEGEQFVCRQFNADMALMTVTKLSADWHEAVAANMSGPNYQFPEPWCPGGRSRGFDVIPITTSAELYLEAKLLHHCVASYQSVVRSGDRYFYSVRQGNARVATLELCESGGSIAIGQIRRACNVLPSKELIVAVKGWFRSQSEFRLPKKPKPVELFDDDIPF